MNEAVLEQGLLALGLTPSVADRQRLIAFAALLLKWNRVYNLTSIRDPAQMITHHLLDSLAVAPFVARHARMADVGSGGGLPGIPLAIVRPDLAVTSIEAVSKKASFQQQARIELELRNFDVVNARVENLRPDPLFDAVISRAFSELADFVRLTSGLLRPGGRFLAMKGVYPEAEIARLPANVRVAEVHPLAVPGLDAERHLLILDSI
ncbi:16S rRNA (guanine(527)-N(7))-methyltransferase RsmG [Rhodocyclaceae bacterium SMB388]